MRRVCERTAVGKIRGLAYPAPELQAAGSQKLEKLRNGIGAILRMKQRVGEPGGAGKIRRVTQQRRERMIGWEGFERRREIVDLSHAPPDSQTAAVILKQVDAGAAIWSVDHDVQRGIGGQHFSQRSQARFGVGEVVQNAGTDDVVERLSE